MQYRNLGKTNIKVSVIGLGAWAIGGWKWGGTDEKQSMRAIDAAIDSGINLIDTAPAYGRGLSERIVGKAIRKKRDKVVVATKCGLIWDKQKGRHFFDYSTGEKVYRYLGPESIREEIEKSLARMGIDYIDLYQTHWQDPTTPIQETMGALMDLKKEGKIRAIGASNATHQDLKIYQSSGQLDADQEKYSLLDTDVEKVLPWCVKNNVTMLAYSPLAQGLLTGKLDPKRKFKGDDIRKNDPRFSFENRAKVIEFLHKKFSPLARKYNLTMAQLSVAALLSRGGVVALCGARNQKQAIENSRAGQFFIEVRDAEVIRSSIENLDL